MGCSFFPWNKTVGLFGKAGCAETWIRALFQRQGSKLTAVRYRANPERDPGALPREGDLVSLLSNIVLVSGTGKSDGQFLISPARPRNSWLVRNLTCKDSNKTDKLLETRFWRTWPFWRSDQMPKMWVEEWNRRGLFCVLAEKQSLESAGQRLIPQRTQ